MRAGRVADGGAAGFFRDVVSSNLGGERVGIYSICSANRYVLEAGMAQALRDDTVVCIESTCNQVNQFGGYSGMRPEDFRRFVAGVAADIGLPGSRVIIGGDHLGPFAWRSEPAGSAMAKASELVRASVLAGYTKIHLDASMRCAGDPGDPGSPLDEELITERTIELCSAAEAAAALLSEGSSAPVYVIGTEVPIPGGERADSGAPAVTRIEDVERTLTLARDAFERAGLRDAWGRVIAVVTQPGVEFGDEVVFDYDREAARPLSACLEANWPLVFEAHSTDHQTSSALCAMVEDHFAILKVGPWLTFAMREALFGLERIERELLAGRDDVEPSRLQATLDAAMVAQPGDWESYYRGDERELRLARAYSYSDRARYYWPRPEVRAAVGRLVANLSRRPIPLTLLGQFLPVQYGAVREGRLPPDPESLVRHRILQVVDLYADACGMR